MELSAMPTGRRMGWHFVPCVSASALHSKRHLSRIFFRRRFFSFRFFSAAVALATWVVAPSVYATNPVGATPGSFAVNPSGAATYSIPIVVPPGTNGMVPRLSLNYNSQGGNGLVGVGWSIGGLSVIHRCGSTIAIDGVKGGVNYDASDKFCLDGERLIWVAAENAYHTQHESWQKISIVDTYFTVTTKDGTVMTYGGTADSQIQPKGNASVNRLWALNRIQDRNGNYLTITYQNNGLGSGEYYPLSIAYTGNGAVVPYNFVYFDYETRTTDVISYYEAGSLVQTTQRLKRLRTCIGSSNCDTALPNLVREYRLSYDINGAVNRSRMTSIQECGTDGVCLPGTNLIWTPAPASLAGAAVNTTISATTYVGLKPTDINGDGRDDLTWYDPSLGTMLALSGPSGFTSASSAIPTSYIWLANGDINGDSRNDVLSYFLDGQYPNFTYPIYESLGISTGLGSHTYSGTTVTPPNASQLADIDADGRADLIWTSGNPTPLDNNIFNYALSTGNGFSSLVNTGVNTGYFISYLTIAPADFNGDGRSDFFWIQNGIQNDRVNYFNYMLSTNAGLGQAISTGLSSQPGQPTAGPWPADINGDGKSDIVWIENNSIYYAYSTGTGFTGATNSNVSVVPVAAGNVTLADINGDGLADVVWMGSDGYIHHSLANGNGFSPGVNSGVTASISAGPWAVDFNGDGKQDLVWLYNGTIYSSLSQGGPSDLLASITDGLGAATQITYSPLTTAGWYSKGNQAQYPYQDVQNATYVVQDYSVSDGVGGNQTTRYWYYGLKRHLTADASLGFARIQRLDPSGLVTDTYYNQTLDGTEGTVASVETWNLNYTSRYKSIVSTWTPVSLGAGRTLAQLSGTVDETRELNNSVVTTVNTAYTYANPNAPTYAYGGDPASVVVNYNDGYSQTIVNTYSNDTTNWILGQLTRTDLTKQTPTDTSPTLTTTFGYYPGTNRLQTETRDPYFSTLVLTATYDYDTFGNRTKKTVTGAGITTRDEYTRQYDARGQFPMWQTNAKNHKTTYNSYDPRNGAVTSLTDPNNLTTAWEYNDGFGRKTREIRPDGTITTIDYGAWSGGTYAHTVASGAGENYVYSDILGRVVQTNTQGFGGNYTFKETQYDSLGRVSKVSHPYFLGETKHYTEYAYDLLGRVSTVTEPGATSGPYTAPRVTTTGYNGLITTVTSPPTAASPGGQTRTTTKNSQGQVTSVTDNAGTTTFEYGTLGYLIKVTDVAGNVTTMQNNLRGLKVSMADPDMGPWTYKYNALGELIEQKDAKNQTIAMGYDLLGRMTSRTIPEGSGTVTSYWTYDSALLGTTGRYALGKLASVSNLNANETYTYDNSGRPSNATTSIGGVAYTTSYTYGANSRLLTLTYPETGFTLYHVYDPYGYLTEIRQDTATGLRYWQATTFDAHGRLTRETFGNNLISLRAYDHATGDLQTIQTGTGASPASVQNSSYQFDPLDNLESRSWYDGATTRNETFGYDNLNRLTTVTGPANKIYAYTPNGNGNIQSKTGVGTYTYPASGPNSVRPHAVTAVAGAINLSYSYDANGNQLTAGIGRNVTYTSFNKPQSINTANAYTGFTYDAGFNRISKTVSSSASTTTLYLGKRYERVTNGSSVTQRHYLYAGNNLIGVYTRLSNGTNSTRYYHTDHLGSVEALTDETGNVVARYGYDAHGLPRNPDGTDALDIVPVPPRGFTGHEHDRGGAELINMNAREYDPIIGRFISPDSLVPGIANSQSYNRYSYALNNPLSRTDPSGNWSLRKAVRSITRAVVGSSVGAANVASAYVVTHKQDIANFTSKTLQKVGSIPYVGGLLNVGLLTNQNFGLAYGWSTGDWRTVGQAHVQGAMLAATAYGLQGMYLGWKQAVIEYWGNIPLATAKFAGQQYVNAWVRQEIANYAERHGMSATEFNLGLFGFSALGNKLFTSRLVDEGWESTKWGFRGWGMRSEFALPFDIADTVLALQGLPNASVAGYFFSPAFGQPLSGHSLGSLDVANLQTWGFVPEARYFAVPFGKVVSGGPVTIGGSDPLAIPGVILNPDAQVVPGVGHPCAGIPGCGV